jgi:hypothetical protein
METNEEYLARKNKEVAYLNSRLRDPFPLPAKISLDRIIPLKFKLRARQIAELCTSDDELTETNITEHSDLNYHAYHLHYSYQRFDLSVRGQPIYSPGIHAALGSGEITSGTSYFASGMSAISSVLLALNRALSSPMHILAFKDTYFETQHVIQTMTPQLRLSTATGGSELQREQEEHLRQNDRISLLLDSFIADDASLALKRLELGSFDLILFDTTCYELSSPRISEVINACVLCHVPLVMLRSHVKLDSLGIEYGRLGSAVFVVASKAAPARLELFRRLVLLCQDTTRILGCAPVPQHLIPYFNEEVFHELNRQRLLVVAKNNQRAAARMRTALIANPIHVVTYHHQMFFTLELNREASRDFIISKVKELQTYAAQRGFPVRHATSFAFDFIVVNEFVDLNRNSQVIRIAVSDLPAEIIDGFCDTVISYLTKDDGRL